MEVFLKHLIPLLLRVLITNIFLKRDRYMILVKMEDI